MYLLNLSFKPWKTVPKTQSFLAALALSILIFFASLSYWLDRNLKPVLKKIKSEQIITAYLEPSIETQDEKKIIDSIQFVLGSNSLQIKSVHSDEFLNELKVHYPDLTQTIESLGNEKDQLLPKFITLSGFLREGDLEKIKAVSGIESVEASKDRNGPLFGAFTALKRIIKISMFVFLFLLLGGWFYFIKVHFYSLKSSLTLLRLMGAHWLTLKAPTLLAAIWCGILVGALSSVIWYFGAQPLTLQFKALSPLLKDLVLPPQKISLYLFALSIALGFLSGVLHREN